VGLVYDAVNSVISHSSITSLCVEGSYKPVHLLNTFLKLSFNGIELEFIQFHEFSSFFLVFEFSQALREVLTNYVNLCNCLCFCV